jgi:hypothetical protein
MNRWRTIILGTLAAAAMAGCGTSQPAVWISPLFPGRQWIVFP